jgi:hypothetical protein
MRRLSDLKMRGSYAPSFRGQPPTLQSQRPSWWHSHWMSLNHCETAGFIESSNISQIANGFQKIKSTSLPWLAAYACRHLTANTPTVRF